MVCQNKLRCLIFTMVVVILPINIRIVSRGSIFVQDLMGTEPTVLSESTSSEGGDDDQGIVSSTADISSSGVGSLFTVTGTSPSQGEGPASTLEAEDTKQEREQGSGAVENDRQLEAPSDAKTLMQPTQLRSDPKRENSREQAASKSGPQATEEEPNDEQEDEVSLTPIAGKNDPNTFSGCLQIMDDNHFLIEWLAYHYHVMPMRRLIVLVDPNSRSSPQPILDRWKDRIHITIWNDTHVYPNEQISPFGTKLLEHRRRQRQFVRRCLQKLHKTGRGWVFLTDTDEYAMISDRVRDPKDFLAPETYAGKALPIPSQEEPGSVLKFLEMEGTMNPHTNESLATIPCLTIARRIFGTKDGEEQPSYMGYDPRYFQTLHWQKYGNTPKPGKSIVNLKYFKYKDINSNPSIHRPGKNHICKGKMWLPEDLSVIVANHYPGTLEQMLFRKDDARGSDLKIRNATKYRIDRFKEYKKLSRKKDSGTIRKWLPGFIASVGEKEAKRLLQYNGLPAEASYLDAKALAAPPVDAMVSTRPLPKTTQPLSTIASKDDTDTFAGCLILMDDNHFLIEWIAYSYHVLPLRRLIVLTDPFSETSPAHILERWQDRINITLWNEHHIYPNGIPPPPNPKKNSTIVGQHRSRQRRFVKLCLQELHKENRDWVVLTDTDEYTMINNRLRDKEDKLSPLNSKHNSTNKNLKIPSQREPGSVMKLLAMPEIILKTKQRLVDNPCITMARKTFGTRSPNTTEDIRGFNSSEFQTLNWKYYDDDGKPGKAIVNLALVNYSDIPPFPSVHRPFTMGDICKGKTRMREGKSPLVVNHYPGNLQQMLFRTHDSRGDHKNASAYRLERFNNYTKIDRHVEEDFVQEWLPGFIDSVGTEEARRLLKNVGNPEGAAGHMQSGATLQGPPVIHFGGPSEQQPETDFNTQAVSREDPNAFASCLMMDDGDDPRLSEWLSYHYHVLPLRRLFLLVDPRSQASPQELLDRWQEHMDITLWSKDHFDMKSLKGSERLVHKALQRMFIRRCLKKLHQEGREWVFVTDIAEYIMINDGVRDAKNGISPLSQGGQHPVLPNHAAPGSVLQFLRREDVRIPHTQEDAKDSACITMSRKTFGGKEGPTPKSPMDGFDVSDLQTMKWRHYADEGKAGRSMINLSKIKVSDIAQGPSPNRPLQNNLCKGSIRLKEQESVLVVNRYTQSVEESKDTLFEKETIQTWLPGFIASVGEAMAKELLAPVETVMAASG